jgi:hypothetical protein
MEMNTTLLKISIRLYNLYWNELNKEQRTVVLNHYYDYY